MNSRSGKNILELLGSKGTGYVFEFPSTLEVLLDYFEYYISTMEIHLDAERSRIIQLKESVPEAYQEEELFMVENVFPNLLRSSLMALIYTVVEDGLGSRCKCLRDLRNSHEETTTRSYLDRYRKCIKRLANIDIDGIQGWEQLGFYGRIRNRVVHNRGRHNPQDTDLRDFVDKTPYLKIEYGQIVVERGACQAFIDIARQFFQTVDRQLPSDCSSPEDHLGFRP